MSSNKRLGKTTPRQYEIMVNFIYDHKSMINSKLTPSFTAQKKEDLWIELTKRLNSDGNGPVKSIQKWKKTWADFKSDVKSKVAESKRRRNKTGGGPPPEDLPPLYVKTAEIIGDILIEGDTAVRETARKVNSQTSFEINDGIQVVINENEMDETCEADNGRQLMNLSFHERNANSTGQLMNLIFHERNANSTANTNATANEEQSTEETDINTPVRPVKKSHKSKFHTITMPDMSNLINEETKKAEALNRLSAAMERNNTINQERNDIEKHRNEIERHRNDLFESAAVQFIEILQRFVSNA